MIRPLLWAVLFFVSGFSFVNAKDHEIIIACQNTVNAYAHARDAIDGDAVGKLFTDQAVFAIGERRMQGRAAIVEAMQERGKQGATIHLVSSVAITPEGKNSARGLSYTLVMGETKSGKYEQQVIVQYDDIFEIKQGVCRFAQRSLKVMPVEREAQ